MLGEKRGTLTKVKWFLGFFACCLVFIALTVSPGFAEHYLSHGVREDLSSKEKEALVHEESRDLCWCEVPGMAKHIDTGFVYTHSGIKGSVRAHLETCDRANLIMEEDESLMLHDLPVIYTRINRSQKVPAMGKNYVYGSVRQNLTDAEKARLAHEE